MTATPTRRRLGRGTHLTRRNIVAYRHGWMIIVSGFIEPFLYLLGIGYGVGSLVGSVGTGSRAIPYAAFVAPALMAASSMNGAIFETTFNFFHKLRYSRTYDTVLATPMGIVDVVSGEVLWALSRSAIYATAFMVVMVILGLAISWWALLAVPAALVLALCFATLGIWGTTFIREWPDFELVQLFLIPMFLFSATFYPLAVYPHPLQVVIEWTPLYHGVHLLRSLTTGTVGPSMLTDIAYLVALSVLMGWLANRRLRRRLLP